MSRTSSRRTATQVALLLGVSMGVACSEGVRASNPDGGVGGSSGDAHHEDSAKATARWDAGDGIPKRVRDAAPEATAPGPRESGAETMPGAHCDAATLPPLPMGGSCGAHEFLYVDRACPTPTPPDSGQEPGMCTDQGDGRCYVRCTTDRDCTDPCRPFCRILGIFDSYDWNCNEGIRICRPLAEDDCTNASIELL